MNPLRRRMTGQPPDGVRHRGGPARGGYNTSKRSGFLRGAMAGAAGTTALNTVTYRDMAVRGRPISDSPERVVKTVVEGAGAEFPAPATLRTTDFRASVRCLGSASGSAWVWSPLFCAAFCWKGVCMFPPRSRCC